MKRVILYLLLAFFQFAGAQIVEPVKWRTELNRISETKLELIAIADIEMGWHLYSQAVPAGGPIATQFAFSQQDNYQLIGKTTEEAGYTDFDKTFKMDIKYFEGSVRFVQQIQIIAPIEKLEAEVEFMACNDTQCTPRTFVDLVFEFPKQLSKRPMYAEDKALKNEESPVKPTKEKTWKETTGITSSSHTTEIKTAPKSSDKEETDKPAMLAAKKEIAAETGTEFGISSQKRGLWNTFLLAFIFGFAALLTPCVFPMIPLTVSFFTKQSKTKEQGIRNAILYGLSIMIIYVLLGVVVSAIFGPSALNELSTNVWFNLIFFAILILFAISFLGAFEITLPSSWGTAIDNKASKGGFVGIFFMALALAIVSFSCTGPIVGTILVEAAAGGSKTGPIVGMLGFSLAIALPFALFAAFPAWLHSLPKSGGWLNTVKVVLGFLELALAFKFLSQADLVLQLHWFERETFIAIWVAIFGTLSLYLLGKIRLPHDSPTPHISVGRLLLGLLSLAFTLYMLPGLWGAPLRLISAFPPPQEYSESPYGVGYQGRGVRSAPTPLPEGAHLLAPHDIVAFNDYDQGLAYAKKVGKAVLLDFTGWACVNCRKMEQNVWPQPKILSILKNEVVLLSLYVDDKRPLASDEVVASQVRLGKKLRYIGEKWSELQTIKYKANSQPFYVLMDHEENNLVAPIAYTPEVEVYHDWLRKGIDTFKQLNTHP
ncbi:MAG: protein-disulfide reductase DsbD family protein [Flavobacteriaceae bacterium]|nr:protein-disulfide reductase DsbD family protein [Flavobacteriaceae bacterium]